MAVDIDKYTIRADWGTLFKTVAKFPVIANRIFKTKAEAEAYLADNSAQASAIPGLILRIIEDTSLNNGAYLVQEDATATATNYMSMLKLMTGDIDIRFDVVWAKKNEQGQWEECSEGTAGAVQCLKLTHAETSTYIPLSELVVLTEYAKIANVDASLYAINTSINAKFTLVDASIVEAYSLIDEVSTDLANYISSNNEAIVDINSSIANIKESIIDLSTNVDEFENLVNNKFNEVDASMIKAFNDIDIINTSVNGISDYIKDNINVSINEINSSIRNINTSIIADEAHLVKLDSSVNDIEETLKNNVVNTLDVSTNSSYIVIAPMDSSHGDVHVSVDASICNSYDPSNYAEGLTTTNYIEERFMWVEIDE